MKKLYMLPLLMLCCALAWAAGESPLSDKALDVPVTIAVKGEALSDIMPMLSKQAGVKLRATKDIGDQKATIFVDSRPLKGVMEALSTIYGYRWSVVQQTSGKVYELWEPAKARLAREAAANGALGAAWQEMDKRIREVAQSSPQDQAKAKAELQQLTADVERKQSITPEEQERAKTLEARSGAAVAMAHLYTMLPSDTVAALRDGCSIYFDTDTSESQWRVPQNIDQDLMARVIAHDKEIWGSRPPTGYNIEFRAWVNGNKITLNCACIGKWPDTDGRGIRTVATGGSPCPEVTIGEVASVHPNTKLPNVADDGALDKKVAFTPKELLDEADLYGQTEKSPSILVTRSDVLSLLHKKLGLQSISDHHFAWFAWDAQGEQTVRYLLDHLKEMIAKTERKDEERYGSNMGAPKADPMWGWDGSSIYMRERSPYEWDAVETPNALIRRLRVDLSQSHYLSLEDVADMSGLSDDQMTPLFRNWDRLIKARGADYRACDQGNRNVVRDPAVKLYGSLTDAQRRAAVSNGLQTNRLLPNQVTLLMKCVGAMTEEHPKEGDQARRRVGIYRDGFRLDKPQADTAGPTFVRLVKGQSQNYNLQVPIAENQYVGANLTASSPNDAWRQALVKFPDLKTRPHFLGRGMGYTMLFTFSDGTMKEHPITLREPVTVTD